MEKWQQLGYESFSAWRHAYDRERRKKLAATKLAAASTPTVRWQPSFAPVPSVLTLLSPSPSSQSQLPLSPPQAPPSDSHLTGTLHDYDCAKVDMLINYLQRLGCSVDLDDSMVQPTDQSCGAVAALAAARMSEGDWMSADLSLAVRPNIISNAVCVLVEPRTAYRR